LPLLPQIAAEFSKRAPIDRLRAHGRPWEGMLCMQPIIQELEALLPGSFADLQRGEGCCLSGRQGALGQGLPKKQQPEGRAKAFI
jgi:hypothetical protein